MGKEIAAAVAANIGCLTAKRPEDVAKFGLLHPRIPAVVGRCGWCSLSGA